jgi:hypothetical protein
VHQPDNQTDGRLKILGATAVAVARFIYSAALLPAEGAVNAFLAPPKPFLYRQVPFAISIGSRCGRGGSLRSCSLYRRFGGLNHGRLLTAARYYRNRCKSDTKNKPGSKLRDHINGSGKRSESAFQL